MHGNCGQMAKTGYRRTKIRTIEHPQTATTAPSIELHWAIVHWLMLAFVAV
jgi:hypothetical protein